MWFLKQGLMNTLYIFTKNYGDCKKTYFSFLLDISILGSP